MQLCYRTSDQRVAGSQLVSIEEETPEIKTDEEEMHELKTEAAET